MRIFIIHNRYQYVGGEDRGVHAESALLKHYGHQVALFETNNDDIQTVWDKIRAAMNVTYSRTARARVYAEITQFQPDVVHVHNFFPRLTPSVYDACRDARVPVVQRLPNYRLICPGALLMRKGRICELCVTASAYHAVWHRCYRHSRFGTLAVAYMVQTHRRRQTWRQKVAIFLTPTQFARQKLVAGGFLAEQIVVKSNFVADPFMASDPAENRQGALFVGRLSPEKGLLTLLQAWQVVGDVPLRIAGTGPLEEQAKAMPLNNVIFLGWQSPEQISQAMRQAVFLIMPSTWYETFGRVIIEAFAHGLPAVVSRLGAMAELVEDHITGLHFEPGNPVDLAEKIRWMHTHPVECQRMGSNARKVYLENYTPEKNYAMLMTIYERVLRMKLL